MYDPPPRRLKRLAKAPDSPRQDWHRTWPRKDVTADNSGSPTLVKRNKSNASDFTTWPRRVHHAPQRSRSEMIDDSLHDIEQQIVQPIPVQIPGESEIVGEALIQASSPAVDLAFEPIFKVVKTEPVWQLSKRVPFAPVRLRKRSSSRLSISASIDLGMTDSKSVGQSMEWTGHLDDELDDPHYAEIKDFQVKTPPPTQPPLPLVSPPSTDFYTIPRRKPRMNMRISPSPERPSASYYSARSVGSYQPERRGRPSSTDFSQMEMADFSSDSRQVRTMSVPPRTKRRGSSAVRGSSLAPSGPSAPESVPAPVLPAEEPVTPKSEAISIAIQTEPMMDYQALVQQPEIKAIIAMSQLGAYEYQKIREEIANEMKLRKELEDLEDQTLSEMNDLNREAKDSESKAELEPEDKAEEDLLEPAEEPLEDEPYDYDMHKGDDDMAYLDEDYEKAEEEYLDEDLDDEYQKEDASYLDDYQKEEEDMAYIDDEYQKEEDEYLDEDAEKVDEDEAAYLEEEMLDEEVQEEDYDGRYDRNGSPSRSEEEYLSRSDDKQLDRDYSQSEEDFARYEREYYRSDENVSRSEDSRYRKESEGNVSRSEEDVGRYAGDFSASEEIVSRSDADVGQLEEDLYRFEQKVGLLEKDLHRFEEDLYRSEEEGDVSQYDNELRDEEADIDAQAMKVE